MKTLILFVFILSFSTSAQPTQEWVNQYPTYGMQWVNAIKITIDSTNTPLVMHQLIGWEVTPQLKLYKLNQTNGTVLWNGSLGYMCYGVQFFLDTLNNIYVSGYEKDWTLGYIPYLSKFSPSGTRIFYVRDISSPMPQYASACLDKSGNSYILTTYFNKYKINKYNSAGQLNWNSWYGDQNTSNVSKVITLDNNNIVTAGISVRNSINYMTLLKESCTSGMFIDTVEYTLPDSVYGYKFSPIKTDQNNNYYLYIHYRRGNNWKNILLKYDLNFILKWTKTDLITYTTPAPNFVLDNTSIYINKITGIEKLDSNGNSVWQFNNGYIVDMSKWKDNNIYLTGSTSNTSPRDMYTAKLNNNGGLVWSITYNYSTFNNFSGLSIALDSNNNVFVQGESYNSATIVSNIKYSQLTGINSINTNVPVKTHLYQNYPNPFNPETKIHFDVKFKQNVKLIIFDIMGKEILKFEHTSMAPGTYEYIWDARNFSSGIYFAKLIGNDYSETKRMVLVK